MRVRGVLELFYQSCLEYRIQIRRRRIIFLHSTAFALAFKTRRCPKASIDLIVDESNFSFEAEFSRICAIMKISLVWHE